MKGSSTQFRITIPSKIRRTWLGPTIRTDKVVFQANDQAFAWWFREASADCPRYPIITRAWRVYRSINRLCCIARILPRSDDVVNYYLLASYWTLMTSSLPHRIQLTCESTFWRNYIRNVFRTATLGETYFMSVIKEIMNVLRTSIILYTSCMC